MTLEQRFTRILELLPDGASVTLTRADLHSLLAVPAEAEHSGTPIPRSDWLTPKQVAEAIGRSSSRVRDLRKDGHFKNAEWNGKEYMTPPTDVEEYLKWRSKAFVPPTRKSPRPTDRGHQEQTSESCVESAPTPLGKQPDNDVDLSGWENALPEIEHRPDRPHRRPRRTSD